MNLPICEHPPGNSAVKKEIRISWDTLFTHKERSFASEREGHEEREPGDGEEWERKHKAGANGGQRERESERAWRERGMRREGERAGREMGGRALGQGTEDRECGSREREREPPLPHPPSAQLNRSRIFVGMTSMDGKLKAQLVDPVERRVD